MSKGVKFEKTTAKRVLAVTRQAERSGALKGDHVSLRGKGPLEADDIGAGTANHQVFTWDHDNKVTKWDWLRFHA